MKTFSSLLAASVLATGIAFAQTDQPATSTDANKPSQADRAAANNLGTPRSDKPDFGWIGLLGLAGLAGLRRRDHVVRDNTTTFTTERNRENMRRAG